MATKFENLSKEEQKAIGKEAREWAEVRDNIMDADYEAYCDDSKWFNEFYRQFHTEGPKPAPE